MNTTTHRARRPRAGSLPILAAVLAGLLVALGAGPSGAQESGAAAQAEQSTCVDCHSEERFLVQNKKLYDYYQGWKLSVHALEGVACADCHGGNPEADGKEAAHGGEVMGSSARTSPINYRNIPDTCARCHRRIFARFKLSAHYEHLEDSDSDEQGPTCVTCHGSVNTTVLNVRNVRQTCEQCHNEETRIAPSIPGKAEHVLNNFLSISRYYRLIALRSEPEEAQAFFRIVDPMIEELNAEWHTFDIDAIEEKTQDLVQFMKVRRNDLLQKGQPRSR